MEPEAWCQNQCGGVENCETLGEKVELIARYHVRGQQKLKEEGKCDVDV